MINRKGLTIIEIIVASGIIAVVIAGCLSFYLMARETWLKCGLEAPLQRKASIAMEKMVRGVRRDVAGSSDIRHINGLREADNIDITSNSDTEVRFNSKIDDPGTIRRFYLKNGNTLCYDNDTDDNGNEIEITDKVNSLNFSNNLDPSDPDPELV
ncbi:MAG: prepilin-type N-terminal cleavage/methylation domain-containing protein, partial [Candidatus Omnitrophota bacterium]|nr:prepilin-type N-terminal cleavage/methylation domain-containing protein [Candidatus Omnitrophota bacterium]